MWDPKRGRFSLGTNRAVSGVLNRNLVLSHTELPLVGKAEQTM